MFKITLAIFIAVVFSGCFGNEPKPCVPVVIKEPFEVKIPVKCTHPVCNKPMFYQFDSNASFIINAKYIKANSLLKDEYAECLESSILTCEGPTGLTESK